MLYLLANKQRDKTLTCLNISKTIQKQGWKLT
jgi:hypothetical protein